ncbi:hypothetical protein CK203_117155 [Vitis vinifera]|uniref:Uncharacterized protein n=1 Tax=Vitis vinifera TaxID=29760 RepID=A0A438E3B5_VITVI|nr:hypothetical protein CK203_117155 [Vitis vinifera]
MANLSFVVMILYCHRLQLRNTRGRGSRMRSWVLTIWTLLQQMPDTTDGSSGVGYDWKKLPSAQ